MYEAQKQGKEAVAVKFDKIFQALITLYMNYIFQAAGCSLVAALSKFVGLEGFFKRSG